MIKKLTVLGASIALLQTTPSLSANAVDSYPDRPIHLLVGSPPGASTDTYARIVADALSKSLGQNVVVENRTGASGLVATNAMLTASPDGYTIQLVYTSYALVPSLYKDNLNYDPATDIAGVSMLVQSPLTLVSSETGPIKALDDLVALSKERSLNYGSAGIGSGGHLTAEMLRLATDMNVVHVPYRGAAPAASALAANDVDFALVSQVTARELMNAGKLRPLAVTSTKRTPMLPDVPTMQELGLKDYKFYNWFGVVAPAKTPRAIVEKLSTSIADILKQDEVRQRLENDGSEIISMTPVEFDQFLTDEIRKSNALVKRIGIQQE